MHHCGAVLSSRRSIICAGLLLSAISMAVVGPRAGRADDVRPAKSNSADNEIDLLVTQLGDDLFSVRENATNQLIQKGIAAKAQLTKATKGPDAEVRMRAKRVLATVVDADFKARLKAFTADTDGARQTTLPGWTEFKKSIGSSSPARELFVEMQTAEPTLMEAFEQGPKEVEQVLKQRSLPAVDEVQSLGRRGAMRTNTGSLGSTLALLFVGGVHEVPMGEDVATRIAMLPSNQAFLKEVTDSSEKSSRRALCLKILGRWVGREVSGDNADRNLAYAIRFNLKEGLTPAQTILQQPQATVRSKSLALLEICRVGEKEQLPLIAPHLSDHHICEDFGLTNHVLQIQLCDLALIATIKLNGQDPKKFGFTRLEMSDDSFPNLHTMAFASDTERAAAFQKWETWQKGQNGGSGEKTAGKPSSKKSE
jgi:hypothetical protein